MRKLSIPGFKPCLPPIPADLPSIVVIPPPPKPEKITAVPLVGNRTPLQIARETANPNATRANRLTEHDRTLQEIAMEVARERNIMGPNPPQRFPSSGRGATPVYTPTPLPALTVATYMEYSDSKSNKFYEVSIMGRGELVTRWGRIGMQGKTKTESLYWHSEAVGKMNKTIREKIKKGYRIIRGERDY